MEIGKVVQTKIVDEMRKSYLDYAMSVIVARALPDVRDGLKPVHRRILYAMHEMGLTSNSPYTKSAKVVGETMGKYHPHGDAPIYDALVRMAQDFSMRYPLIDGQGNFGSVDGDPPAAMRYTEVRLAKISDELLRDIDKNTVEFENNFDDTLQEPKYLPALLPNLLLMGAEGIAVGMATKIPPHNLGEIVDAIQATIHKGRVVYINGKEEGEKKAEKENGEFIIKRINLLASKSNSEEETIVPPNVGFESAITVEELAGFVKGPDFPTGGIIYGGKHLPEVYGSGRGKITVRGVAKIEQGSAGKAKIVITELPYQVNKSLLIKKIAQLVKEKKLAGIADIRDESDKKGISVVVELRRDARPKAILNNLYKHTDLQTSFPANFVALVDGVPKTLNLKQILVEYIKHRQKVVTKRTIHDLLAAKRKSHILEGLKIAIENLDAVIRTIRRSRDTETAKQALMSKFGLTEPQALAILEMQLRRLSALEREKIEKEYEQTQKIIANLTMLIKHPEKVLEVISNEISELKEKYADKRRTKIVASDPAEIADEDLIPKEDVIVTLTRSGYIKRVPRAVYKSQNRGGKGVVGMTTKNEDEIIKILAATTHDTLLLFTNKGRVFKTRVWEIASGTRQSKGQAIVNIINLEQDERVEVMLSLEGQQQKDKYLIFATKNGVVKKTKLSEFKNIRSTGIMAIRLEKGDLLWWVHPTDGLSHILIVTKKGKSIRFSEKDLRPLGRSARGVRGIKLVGDDEVVGMEVFPAKPPARVDKRRKTFRDILIVTQNGIGKRTPIQYFPIQRRGGIGVKAANITQKTGEIASAILVNETIDQIIITSSKGQIIRLPVKNIPQLGRATQGVILMRFSNPTDHVAAVATLNKEEKLDLDDQDKTNNNQKQKKGKK